MRPRKILAAMSTEEKEKISMTTKRSMKRTEGPLRTISNESDVFFAYFFVTDYINYFFEC